MAELKLDHLHDDWMSDWLQEREVIRLNSDGSNGVHLVQMIQGRHGDHTYYETTDLGKVKRPEGAGDMFVYGGGITRVGRMRDVANRERERRGYAERYGLEAFGDKEMLDLLLQSVDEQWKVSKAISTIGPAVRRQR